MMLRWSGDRARAIILARARRVVGHACDSMAGRAREYSPVDSGNLKESIAVVPGLETFRVVVGVDYADPVHNGHLAGSTWVPPNPFLWRAIEDTRARWPRLVREMGLASGFTRSAGFDRGGSLIDTSGGRGEMTATFQIQT